MKLVLVSHENTLCTGLALWLEQQRDLEVTDAIDFSMAEEFLEIWEITQPDFLLIECKRVDASVSSLLSRVQQLQHQPRTIVLGARVGARQIALDAGADAFVYEGDGAKKLLTTIRSLDLDKRYAA